MTDAANVWVKTAALEKAITGKTTKEIKRSLPTDQEDEFIDWGWAYAKLQRRDDSFIEITVQDENSPHHGATTKLPPDSFKTGVILAGNKYSDDEDFENEDEAADNVPDDLIILTHLHEAEVVHCLRQRYLYDKIYTDTGPILLALNPFKNCKQLYSKKVMEEYTARGELAMRGIVDEEKSLPPHVYGIADRSFRSMMQAVQESKSGSRTRAAKGGAAKSSDQAILVSGESGAGKTVTTKFIMQYLASLSQRTNTSDVSKSEQGGKTIEQQVLQSNPILESFGNARTIRNDNSSRFGKFIEMKFKEGVLVGASIESYLLEKVRLISQSEGERNYHIFYELFCMGDEKLEKYHLEIYNPEDFSMTNQSGTYNRRDGVEDFETYDDLSKAMEVLGMTEEEVHDVLAVAAAALHASNITFLEITNDESELDTDNPHLEPFLNLMGLAKEELGDALCYLQIKAGREFHKRTLSKAKAEKGMEALIKAFYGALFHFLVRRINSSITVKDGSRVRRRVTSSTAANDDSSSIGVLDIFGFESFKHNSFEQLCINFCNEALQQQFNLFVLKNEQAEYAKEGIEWSFISFPDNQEVLDLIDKKGQGILNILDDQCRAPGTTDKTFCIDLYKKLTGNPRFEADHRQVGAQLFGVKHYAGPVEYSTAGFVEKNRDELPKEATDLLFGSTKEIIQELATILSDPNSGSADAKARSISPSRPGAKTAKVTVSSQFSRQLRDLRAKIDLTSPHYVRCLKPNDLLIPDHFNPLIISDQLRYAGVIEAVRVSRVGYPHRYTHSTFVARYRILAGPELKKAQRSTKRVSPAIVVVNALASKVWKVQCEQERAEGDVEEKKDDDPPSLISVGLQIGKTKVFLRRSAYEIIEQLRSSKNGESAVKIQAIGRRYITRRDYQVLRRGLIAIQCLARVHAAKALVHERRLQYRATRIQTLFRMEFRRKQYNVTRAVAKWIQRVQRGRKARQLCEELNQNRKATLIQSNWRFSCARKKFKRSISAIIIIQCATRCRSARRTFRELKLQARDLNSAVAERDSLRQESQLLRQQLKDAQRALVDAEKLGSSSANTVELESAQKRIQELESEVTGMKNTLKAVEGTKLKEEKRALDAEAAAKASESKAAEQLSRAEKYKKRFVEDHEQLKIFKAEQEKNDVQLARLRGELEAAGQLIKESMNNEKTKKELEKQLLETQKELSAVKDQQSRTSTKLEDKMRECDEVNAQVGSMVSERNELARQLKSAMKGLKDLQVASTVATPTVHTSSAELEEMKGELKAAKMLIQNLERKLAESNSESESVILLQSKLDKVEKQAAADLEKKKIEIKKLRKELETSLIVASQVSKAVGHTVSDDNSNEEIMSLREKINQLEDALDEARQTQPAGQLDPSSPAALAQRYDELRRLAEAGLEKDREIEKLKAKIDDLENDVPPSELNNNEEADALRTYIHELQMEISKLREDAAERVEKAVPVRRTSLLSIITGTSDHDAKSQPAHFPDADDEDLVGELQVEVEALKEMNNLLRGDIEKSRKRISSLETELQQEKETSKMELESFARTLRGVDELRSVAESMSRQVQSMKTHSPNNSGVGFTDEIVDGFDGQMKLIESARDGFEKDAAGRNEKKQPSRGFWGFGLMMGDDNAISEDDEMRMSSSDDLEEDLRKIMASTKQKRRRKKKRRGSGNSIVSSFF